MDRGKAVPSDRPQGMGMRGFGPRQPCLKERRREGFQLFDSHAPKRSCSSLSGPAGAQSQRSSAGRKQARQPGSQPASQRPASRQAGIWLRIRRRVAVSSIAAGAFSLGWGQSGAWAGAGGSIKRGRGRGKETDRQAKKGKTWRRKRKRHRRGSAACRVCVYQRVSRGMGGCVSCCGDIMLIKWL